MSNFQLMSLSSLTVLIPTCCAIIRFKQLDRLFYPYVFLVFLMFINELTAWIILRTIGHEMEYSYNVFFLIESIVITYQFKRWGLFKTKDRFFYLAISSYFLVWLVESYHTRLGNYLNSYFIIFYSLIVVLMSLRLIYELRNKKFDAIVIDPVFIICSSFLLFFAYTIITEAVSIYDRMSADFRWKVINILNIVYIISNIGHSIAIFKIRKGRGVFLGNRGIHTQ